MSYEFSRENVGDVRSFVGVRIMEGWIFYGLSCSLTFLYIKSFLFSLHEKETQRANKTNIYKQTEKHTSETKSSTRLSQKSYVQYEIDIQDATNIYYLRC